MADKSSPKSPTAGFSAGMLPEGDNSIGALTGLPPEALCGTGLETQAAARRSAANSPVHASARNLSLSCTPIKRLLPTALIVSPVRPRHWVGARLIHSHVEKPNDGVFRRESQLLLHDVIVGRGACLPYS